MANQQQVSVQQKLDQVWQEVARENAVDFLRKAVGPETTITELMSVLSYDKVQGIKDQLGNVKVENVMSVAQPKRQTTRRRRKRRQRTTREEIEREENIVLKTIKDNPDIDRNGIVDKVQNKLKNKNPSHVTYLLRRLRNEGKIKMGGTRRDATYQAA